MRKTFIVLSAAASVAALTIPATPALAQAIAVQNIPPQERPQIVVTPAQRYGVTRGTRYSATPTQDAQAAARDQAARNVATTTTGAAAGTLVGVGLANSWWTGSLAASLPASAAGAAVAGGVVGVGVAGLIDMATRPCAGFHAIGPFAAQMTDGCVNGRWVGRSRG